MSIKTVALSFFIICLSANAYVVDEYGLEKPFENIYYNSLGIANNTLPDVYFKIERLIFHNPESYSFMMVLITCYEVGRISLDRFIAIAIQANTLMFCSSANTWTMFSSAVEQPLSSGSGASNALEVPVGSAPELRPLLRETAPNTRVVDVDKLEKRFKSICHKSSGVNSTPTEEYKTVERFILSNTESYSFMRTLIECYEHGWIPFEVFVNIAIKATTSIGAAQNMLDDAD